MQNIIILIMILELELSVRESMRKCKREHSSTNNTKKIDRRNTLGMCECRRGVFGNELKCSVNNHMYIHITIDYKHIRECALIQQV